MLIAALDARYSADPAADRKALDVAYADAMTGVAAAYPDDDQVQVLFADALMNLQPWDYWEADKHTPKGRTASRLRLEGCSVRRNPDDPFSSPPPSRAPSTSISTPSSCPRRSARSPTPTD